jgi:hypothetical protein
LALLGKLSKILAHTLAHLFSIANLILAVFHHVISARTLALGSGSIGTEKYNQQYCDSSCHVGSSSIFQGFSASQLIRMGTPFPLDLVKVLYWIPHGK